MTDTVEKRHLLALPEPILVIDTREQQPYFCGGRRPDKEERGECRITNTKWVCGTLSEGDYQLYGVTPSFAAVERKSLQDLIGSLIQGQDRFFAELETLMTYRFPAVVVEADWQEIKSGEYRSAADPKAIMGLIIKIQQMRIPVHLCGSRVNGQEYTLQYLSRAWRLYHDGIYGGKHYIKKNK